MDQRQHAISQIISFCYCTLLDYEDDNGLLLWHIFPKALSNAVAKQDVLRMYQTDPV